MLFVVDGAVSASLHLPGDRDGRDRASRARGDRRRDRAARRRRAHDERARDRDRDGARARPADFAALLAGQDPSAFRLKRRLASLFTARLRNQLRHLAESLGGEIDGPPAEDARTGVGRPGACGPPDSRYVRRMATFHDFDPLALWGFLTSGSYVRCPPGRTLVAEGRRRRPTT
jgi:hypothetical protein